MIDKEGEAADLRDVRRALKRMRRQRRNAPDQETHAGMSHALRRFSKEFRRLREERQDSDAVAKGILGRWGKKRISMAKGRLPSNLHGAAGHAIPRSYWPEFFGMWWGRCWAPDGQPLDTK